MEHIVTETDAFAVRTEPRNRGQNSHASTVPRSALARGGAPTGDDAVVRRRVEADTERRRVEFDPADGGEAAA